MHLKKKISTGSDKVKMMWSSARERGLGVSAWVYGVVLCVGMALSGCAGCSDDNVNTNTEPGANNGTGAMCPDGERYNPILARCVPIQTTPADMAPDQPPAPDMGSLDMTVEPDMVAEMDVEMDIEPDMVMEPEPDMVMEPDMAPDMTVEPDMAPDMPMVACGTATITGVACVPSGDALPGAKVTVSGTDCATGQPFTREVIASGTGRYEVTDVPTGEVSVTLESGSFNRTFDVTLTPGQNVDLTTTASKVCIEGTSVSIAVIGGDFDKVEDILDDLELAYDKKGTDGGAPGLFGSVTDTAGFNQTLAFLQSLSAMQQYDIIFINCGYLWDNMSTAQRNAVRDNLFAYVNSGKSLYASDWAYMFIESPFPAIIDFLGADTTLNDVRQGYAPQLVMAAVESTGLQTALGATTVAIDFPHNPPTVINNNWAMMEGANMAATVHLRSNVQRCGGAGCPPGATIMGAPLLVTYKSPMGGALGFTSFHNHGEGTPVSPQISQILKYLIFQL